MFPPGFLRRRGAGLLAWSAFLLALAAAHAFVLRFGTATPTNDDLLVGHWLRADVPLDWAWVFSPHNEHRLPLGKLVYLGVLEATHDFRAPTLVTLWLVAGLTAGLMLLARRLRGRTSAWDAFFPLLWLSCGHAENFLSGWSLTIALDLALLVAIWLLALDAGERIGSARAAGLGFCFLAIALAGPVGWLPALPCAGLILLRAGLRPHGASLGLAACVLLYGAAVLWQVLNHASIPGHAHGGWGESTRVALQFLTTSLGAAAALRWPWSGVFVLGLAAASVVALGPLCRAGAARRQAQFLVAAVAGMLLLAASIGIGRAADGPGAGFLDRYAHYSAPLVSACFLGWCLRGPASRAGSVAQACFALGWAAAALPATRHGLSAGAQRVQAERELVDELRAGATLAEASQRHWRRFFYSEAAFTEELDNLRCLALGPFQDAELARTWRPDAGYAAPMMRAHVHSTSSSRPLRPGEIEGVEVLFTRPPAELELVRRHDQRRVTGRYGIAEKAWSEQGCDGVRFRVEVRDEHGARRTVFERELDPRARAADRGFQSLDLELPGDAGLVLLFVTDNAPGHDELMDWAYWTELELR